MKSDCNRVVFNSKRCWTRSSYCSSS